MQHGPRRSRRQRTSHTVTAILLAVGATLTVGTYGQGASRAVTTTVSLMPDDGQFFPTAPVKVLDTRDGTGITAPAQLAAGATVNVQVAGVGSIPQDVSDAYVVITAINPAQPGALEDYDPDFGNPGIWAVPFAAGETVSVSDLVQVSDAGQVAITNASPGTADVEVTAIGYTSVVGSSAPGDTFAALLYGGVLDTRSGFGAPAQAQIPAGGSLTFQVTGMAGVPADAAGAAVYLGAANASAAGFISAYPAGGTDPVQPIVSYSPGRIVRNLYFGSLPSSGKLTLVNHGSAPIDMMAAVQGYLVGPSSAETGSSYTDVTPQRIADTRSGTGGVQATPIPAGGSITFAATGTDDVPATGVSAVVESVAASSPTAKGLLSVYPANTADPGNAGVNFNAGDSQDNDLTAPLVSAVSPTGEETITNHSTGTVDVIVSLRGYYLSPAAPGQPRSVAVSLAATSATVTWAPPITDGGAPLTGYTISASPDTVTSTVDPATNTVTLTGLHSAAADVFSVAAINAVGPGQPASSSPLAPTVSGTLQYPASPANLPMPGDQVLIYDAPVDPTATSQTLIGTAVTDQNGNWSYTIPAFSSLPADVQADVTANGGFLNVEIDAYSSIGMASGSKYMEFAEADEPAWVGTGTQAIPDGVAAPQPAVMVLAPLGTDNSAGNTLAAQESTFAAENDPEATNGSIDPDAAPPLDSFGFQSVGPDNNYNPYVAYDGTNLTGVRPQPFNLPDHSECTNWYSVPFSGPKWSELGAVYSGENSTADFSYTKNSETTFDTEVSLDGEHASVSGHRDIYNKESSTTTTWPTIGPGDSREAQLYEDYADRRHSYAACDGYAASHTDRVWAEGTDTSTSTFPLRWGPRNALNGNNGISNWCNAKQHHSAWVQKVSGGFGIDWPSTKGHHWGVGASVEGIGIGMETDYTTITDVTYIAGKGKFSHWIWGQKGNPYRYDLGGKFGSDPEVIYAYDLPNGNSACL